MSDLSTLRIAFDWQARFCRGSNSPFSALVFEQILAGLGLVSPYTTALAPWTGAQVRAILDAAVPLRLLAVFHYLALGGRSSALAAFYPPGPIPDGDRLGAAMLEAIRSHPDVVASFMASPPQTNEVGRSLALVGGFLTVAKATGLPLRCLELGASAGLNMNWDRYGYRFGDGAGWGDPASPVQLSGSWEGGSPPTDARVEVAERRACDQNPIDVTDPERALRLQSYVWADQTLRLERLRAAIGLKQATGGVPERADAADWAEAHVHPQEGVATVVYHSSFIGYPSKAVQARIIAAIRSAGARATPASPVAWLSKEPDPANPAAADEVLLTLWDGTSAEGTLHRLALAHAHGAWVRWLG